MNVAQKTIRDRTLVEFIKRFVRAGIILFDGLRVRTNEGTPQGAL